MKIIPCQLKAEQVGRWKEKQGAVCEEQLEARLKVQAFVVDCLTRYETG